MALAAWKKLKVKLEAELVPLPRAHDAEYDEVIREWELVLSWSMQHEAGDEAVVAREKLADLRARREKPRQPPVTHADRLWSRFRVDPKVLNDIAEIAVAHCNEDLDKFREAIFKRPRRIPSPSEPAPCRAIDEEVNEFKRAEIQWQDRLANQAKMIASDDTHSIGGWAQVYLGKE